MLMLLDTMNTLFEEQPRRRSGMRAGQGTDKDAALVYRRGTPPCAPKQFETYDLSLVTQRVCTCAPFVQDCISTNLSVMHHVTDW